MPGWEELANKNSRGRAAARENEKIGKADCEKRMLRRSEEGREGFQLRSFLIKLRMNYNLLRLYSELVLILKK